LKGTDITIEFVLSSDDWVNTVLDQELTN